MTKETSFFNGDGLTGLLVALVGVYAIIGASGFEQSLAIRESLGPAVIPKAVGALLIAAGLIIIWQGRKKPAGFTPKDGVYWFRSVRFLAFIGLTAVYIGVMDYLGYIGSTVAFMILAQLLMSISWQRAIISAAVVVGSVYALFGVLIEVPLPEFSLF